MDLRLKKIKHYMIPLSNVFMIKEETVFDAEMI